MNDFFYKTKVNSGEDKAKQHFNEIAKNYKEEIPCYVRDHLINKWWSLVNYCFSKNSSVIDIGCGDGTNVAFLRNKGLNAIGVDISDKLIKRGKERYPQLEGRISEGNSLNLQFKDNTFDVATLIGVLHHIDSRRDQYKAIQEALRVVKNDGVVTIRESNLINPLFRLFWNYIFPLTARIDKFGGENWISAGYLSGLFKEIKDQTFFFTFIPDFIPQSLIPLATRVERYLENSPFKKLSAHYVVVLKKRNKL